MARLLVLSDSTAKSQNAGLLCQHRCEPMATETETLSCRPYQTGSLLPGFSCLNRATCV